MKKSTFVLVLVGVLIVSFSTTFAAFKFTDEAGFASWFKSAVMGMSQQGIMQGYPDGTFKPENAVNRAELAVMFDRFEKQMIAERRTSFEAGIEAVLISYDNLANQAVDHKVWVAMADAGYRKLSVKPDLTDFVVVKDAKLPKGYTLYEYRNIVSEYYLNYKGERIDGDVSNEVDEWFGLFY